MRHRLSPPFLPLGARVIVADSAQLADQPRTTNTHHTPEEGTNRMYSKIRAAIALGIAACAVFAFAPTSATAGQYAATPPPCALTTYPLGSTWHSGFAGADFGCVGTARVMTITGSTGGGLMWMKSQRLPDGAYLRELSLWSYYSNGNSNPNEALVVKGCLRYSGGTDVWEVPGANYECAGYPIMDLRAWGNNNWATRAGIVTSVCGANCGGFMVKTHLPLANLGGLGIDSIQAIIGDDIAPVVSANSRQISSGTWLSGDVTIGATATDSGAGVDQIVFIPDLSVPATNVVTAADCTAGAWIPCPASSSSDKTWNSNQVSDGAHTARYTARDYAGNTAQSATVSYKVDNTLPAPITNPEVETDGHDGWSSNNAFKMCWDNNGETVETLTQSGLESVIVDVDATQPGQSDPVPVTIKFGETVNGMTATLDAETGRGCVDGITVPDEGEWRTTITVVDKAGNTSQVGEEGEIPIGYDSTPPAKADGEANGWASDADLNAGRVVQRWEAPLTSEGSESPVCGWALSVSQNQYDAGGTTINVAVGHGREWTIPNTVPEGINWVHIRAISCAGVPAIETEHQELKVDRTDPTGSYSGVEPGRWYMDGRQVTMCGTDALSGMVGAPWPEEPLSTSGAYIAYSINGSGPADADAPRGNCATVPVTGEGPKTLKFSPVDFAGNKASPTEVDFGIDATSPDGYLAERDPNRPTLISATLADAVSGLENAVIQIRGATGPWVNLPTGLASFSGGQVGSAAKSAIAEARFPDTRLPKGTYEVRVLAFDQAGNQLVTSKLANGQSFTVDNPMRKPVGLSAAIYRGLRKCKKKRKSKCIKKKKGTVYLAGGKTSTTVGYRRAGVVQGFLTTSSYSPLSRRPIEIWTKAPGSSEILAETVSTKADGSYYYRLRPGVSRRVRVVFPGSELLQDKEAGVNLGTAAKVTLKVNKRKVRTGQKVTFRGKVSAIDKRYPARGKIIALQYLSGGKWRPAVAITRTDKKGNFKVSYRFDRIPRRVRAKITFRVWVPSEVDFSHSNSKSLRRVVRVNF